MRYSLGTNMQIMVAMVTKMMPTAQAKRSHGVHVGCGRVAEYDSVMDTYQSEQSMRTHSSAAAV